LSELADFDEIHGHWNVPYRCSKNSKLARWVELQKKGKSLLTTLSRIQALESLGFEWKPAISRGKGKPKRPTFNADADATRVRERTFQFPEHMQTTAKAHVDFSVREIRRDQVDASCEIRRDQVDASYEAEESDWNDAVHLAYIPGRNEEI
jgi:hypothetical protein